MNKQEFIEKLRLALNGRVEPGVVMENVNYYEDYINMEIRKGKREEDVLSMLGDPRLIAKTIIATNPKSGQDAYQDGEYQNAGYQGTGHPGSAYGNSDYQNNEYGKDEGRIRAVRMPGWLGAAIGILVVVLIFSVVLSVLSFLAPVIITVLVVMFLVKLFRDWLN